MADIKISDFSAASALTGAELFETVQGGANKKVTADQVKTFVAAPAELNDLADVDAGAPTDGQALVWDETAGQWKPETIASGGGTTLPSLTGNAGKVLKVKTDASGVEWSTDLEGEGGGGGGGPGAHAYWRLLITATGATKGWTTIAELELKETEAGDDLAVGGTPTVDSSTGTAADIFDGNLVTYWESANTAVDHWVAYHFTAPITLNVIRMRTYSAWPDEVPTAFTVQYSDDGTTWVDSGWDVTDSDVTLSTWRQWLAPWLGETVFAMPEVVAGDGGKVLKVKSDLSGVEWSTDLEGSGGGGGGSADYDVGFAIEGKALSSEVVGRFTSPRPWTIPAGGATCIAEAGIAATASATFSLRKNGTAFGTVAFAAAGVDGVFTIASDVTFARGDLLTIVAPSAPDATLADIAITLSGART